jgi:hypothetical protein
VAIAYQQGVEMITWDFNNRNEYGDKYEFTDDEIELLRADIQDAIDGVLEDWGI